MEDFVRQVIDQASRFGLPWWAGILLILILAVAVVGIRAGIAGLKNLPPLPSGPDSTGVETPGGGPGDDWLKTHPQPPPDETPGGYPGQHGGGG